MDRDRHLLDILVQRWRDKKAEKRFFRKLLRGLTYVPRVITTEQLRSYGTAPHERPSTLRRRREEWLHTAIAMGRLFVL